ncbi:MAG: glycoside hydrolase family 113, partial [Catenulispora sp.]
GMFTPTDAQVTAVIAAAHAAGLAVEVNPILWAQGTYIWRGALDPQDIDGFWASYSAMILRYAKLAQSDGAELFTIGSEYSHLERYAGRWRSLAAAVRQVYSGKLTYMAVTYQVAKVRFWRSVDYIGTSPYYALSDAPVPTYAELRAAWNRPFRLLHAVWLKYRRPVLFNETGYLSAQSATAAPWVPTPAGPASQTLQANAYAAVLDAASTRPWMKGVVFYAWSTTSLPIDQTWSPRDKRAECEMARRWSASTSPRMPDGFPVGCIGADLAASSGMP